MLNQSIASPLPNEVSLERTSLILLTNRARCNVQFCVAVPLPQIRVKSRGGLNVFVHSDKFLVLQSVQTLRLISAEPSEGVIAPVDAFCLPSAEMFATQLLCPPYPKST